MYKQSIFYFFFIFFIYLFIFVCVLRLNVPVNSFSDVGTGLTLPGYNQFCRELMCLV